MTFKKQLEILATQQGINSERVDAVVNTYTNNQIQNILEKYGYSMIGILIVMAENALPIDFAKQVTPPDGNCYMHALENQTIENRSVVPHLAHEHLEELHKDKKQLRKLWCQTGKGYYAGKWGSKVNFKGNMPDEKWEED